MARLTRRFIEFEKKELKKTILASEADVRELEA
jgi:hypothetical protein